MMQKHGYIRKVFFYTFWKCEKLEAFLSNMEKKGFRLVGVSCSHIFYFNESKPRDTRYVDVIFEPKRYSFLDYRYKLKREFNADEIPVRNCWSTHLIEIYRICDLSADLSDFMFHRKRYFVRVGANNLFLSFILLIIPVMFLILSLKNSMFLASVLFAVPTLLCLSIAVHSLFALIQLWKECRGIEETK